MSYQLFKGNVLEAYETWPAPDLIVCDGPYALGKTSQSKKKRYFDEDMTHISDLSDWYEPHRKAWMSKRTNRTILLFFGTEISWAQVHSSLTKDGWQYIRCSVWNKGVAHIAGNINTASLNQFPCVTEVCVMYIPIPTIDNLHMKDWLRREWRRTGLKMADANTACESKSAASRKYLTSDDQWYMPSPEMFEKLSNYANIHGTNTDAPYFKGWGKDEWLQNTIYFNLSTGITNVWDFKSPAGKSRHHPNQKPVDMVNMLLQVCTKEDDVIWDCFAGSSIFGRQTKKHKRNCFGAEINEEYWHLDQIE